jgi:outer membrane biosynthesis protein TonB
MIASAETVLINNRQVPKSLVMSLTGHVLVVLILTVKAVFFQAEDIIVSSAIRVDIVALPEKIKPPKEEEIKPEVKEEKVVEEKPVEKILSKAEKKKILLEKAQLEQKKALESLKDQLKRDQEAIEEVKKSMEKPEPKIFKGNILAPGSEITGVAKIEYDKYFDVIRSNIKNNLVLPKWLKDANLKTYVLMKLDERGYVIYKSVSQTSGNEMYDNLILTAIGKASPFPAPPERLTNIIQVDGITLRFPDK